VIGTRFNRVTFGVPVEAFDVSAYVAITERLPIVTEFILKVVHACGSLSVASLRGFFGFSDVEVISVVESLSNQGLLILEGDSVRLSQYASERFQDDGKPPSFSVIERKRDKVTFDLLTYFPLPGNISPMPTDCVVKLDAPEKSLGSSVEMARAAYREHYEEIAFRREDMRERSHGVYSIEDIESRRRSYFAVNVNLTLDADGQVRRIFDDQFESIVPQDLVNAVAEQVARRMPSTLKLTGVALEEFIASFDAKFLEPYVRGKGFDLARFAIDVRQDGAVKTPKGVKPIFGNLYLPENLEGVLIRVKRRLEGKSKRGPLVAPVVWLAPDHFLWGRGDGMANAVGRLSDLLCQEQYGKNLYLCAHADGDMREREVKEQLRISKLTELHFVRPRVSGAIPMDGRLEILLMPAGFVYLLFHHTVPGGDGSWAPFGFVSRLPKHLEAARQFLSHQLEGAGYGGRARFSQKDDRAPAKSVEEAMPFLLQAPPAGDDATASDDDDEDLLDTTPGPSMRNSDPSS
jgi:hypothetical protein